MSIELQCWCKSKNFSPFSEDYVVCQSCHTLLSQKGLSPEKTLVKNDEEDFYGKNYWLGHQNQDLGYPDIFKRAQEDLPERCMHWLRSVLKYKLPPAKTLEIGCAHGGFVSLLKESGYDASGLEMSPWIAEFAKKTFQIPMFTGPIEQQDIALESLDMILMMDVLEHLPDPSKTIQHCLKLLKKDGILVIQTPNYPQGVTFTEMKSSAHPFLEQLKADEHLFLFSEHSLQEFFKKLNDTPLYLQFEPAMFPQYDMFCMVSKTPLMQVSNEKIEEFLTSTPQNRIIHALLSLAQQRDRYIDLYKQADRDRVARLKIIDDLRYTKTGLIRFGIKNIGRILREKLSS